jgi:hypothetical protein
MKIWGDPEIQTVEGARSEVLGQPEESTMAKPEGAIRGNLDIHQPVPEDGNSGQPENSSSAIPKDRGTRATWVKRPVGTAEGCEIRGNSEIHRRQSRKMQRTGQPGNSSIGATRQRRIGATRSFNTGGVEDGKSGQLDNPLPAQPNGLNVRGNSWIRRQRGLRMRSTGQPGDALLAKPEDRGEEATLNLIWKLNGTMHDSTSCKDIRERQRPKSLWRFHFVASGKC